MNVEETAKWLTHRYSNKKTILNSMKVGRNDLCSCGSKMKYKYCCGDQNKQNEQRIDQMMINDEIINMTERNKFEQLIKKGIIVRETSKGTKSQTDSFRQIRLLMEVADKC